MSYIEHITNLKENKIMVKKLNQTSCHHKNKTWQPEERENNVPESLSCDDCGEDLELLEECC